jgi:glutathione S-transferase
MSIPQLVSHHLCPYVQRAAISFAEKAAPFERVSIDLANRPAWFTDISPLGKVPLLRVGSAVIFESAVILEYLEDTVPPRLHPADPLVRADHRAWIEFGSAILNTIAGLYAAADSSAFELKRDALARQFAWVERRARAAPWFDGQEFSLVDATFGPIFRYFDVFDTIAEFGIFDATPKIQAWRRALAARPSVRRAVAPDYPERLAAFLRARNSHLSAVMRTVAGDVALGAASGSPADRRAASP